MDSAAKRQKLNNNEVKYDWRSNAIPGGKDEKRGLPAKASMGKGSVSGTTTTGKGGRTVLPPAKILNTIKGGAANRTAPPPSAPTSKSGSKASVPAPRNSIISAPASSAKAARTATHPGIVRIANKSNDDSNDSDVEIINMTASTSKAQPKGPLEKRPLPEINQRLLNLSFPQASVKSSASNKLQPPPRKSKFGQRPPSPDVEIIEITHAAKAATGKSTGIVAPSKSSTNAAQQATAKSGGPVAKVSAPVKSTVGKGLGKGVQEYRPNPIKGVNVPVPATSKAKARPQQAEPTLPSKGGKNNFGKGKGQFNNSKKNRACRCGNNSAQEYWQALESKETYCSICWEKILARNSTNPQLGLLLGLEAMRDLEVELPIHLTSHYYD